MPKIKSTKEKLEEKGIFSKPVDLDPDWYGKHLRAKAEAEEKVRKDEEERIAKLACPLCKSTTKAHIVKSGSMILQDRDIVHGFLMNTMFVKNVV